MDLSIIIVSYNTIDITRKCLQSVISQTCDIEYEIICVDNNSQDGSVKMIKNEFPSVLLIENQENQGFAKAQNIGILHSVGQYVLVLNSDVYFVGNVCRKMIDFLAKGPVGRGAVGPRILNPDNTVAPSAGIMRYSRKMLLLSIINRHFYFKRFLPEKMMRKYFGFILGKLHYNYSAHDQIQLVDFVDGMCVLLKREVLQKTGLFDEQFFFDSEILDLMNRMNADGWKVFYFPEVQVIHLGQASRKKHSPILVEKYRSELIFHAKYNKQYVPFLQKAAMVVTGIRIFFAKIGLIFNKSHQDRIQTIQLCRRIQQVVQTFDADAAIMNPRIPFLR